MWRWNPQNVLEVKCAELGNKKQSNQGDHVEPAFQTGRWIPVVLYPIVRTELGDYSFQFALDGRRVPEAAPIVLFHGEVLARFHTEIDAEAIADQKVQYPMVPPALGEIGQLVL